MYKIRFLGLALIFAASGFFIGYIFGMPLVRGFQVAGITKNMGSAFSLLVIGGGIFWFCFPLENRYVWNRLKGIDLRDLSEVEKVDILFSFAPFCFFFISGINLYVRFNM